MGKDIMRWKTEAPCRVAEDRQYILLLFKYRSTCVWIAVCGSDRYYFDEKGIRQESKWIDVNGKRYYAMEDGKLRVGWLKTGSTYYYCGPDAALIVNQNYPVNGVLYTFDANGVRQIKPGWGEYNGNRYYINAQTGFPYTGG